MAETGFLKFLLIAAINNFAVGAYTVLVAWQANSAGGVSAVGTVFLASSLVGIFLPPVLGTIIDRTEKRKMIFFAQIGKVVLGTMPLVLLTFFQVNSSVLVLSIVAGFMSVFNNTYGLSINPLIKSNIDESKLESVFAYISTSRELGIVIGSLAGGYALLLMDFSTAFLIISVACLSSIFVAAKIPVTPPKVVDKSGMDKNSWFSFAIFRSRASSAWMYFIILSVILTGLSAFINTVLPNFVQQILAGDSNLYGEIEAAWSIGGVLVGLLIGGVPFLQTAKRFDPTLLIIGFLLVYISSLDAHSLAIIAHAAVGGIFTYGFIISQSMITKLATQDDLGKLFGITRIAGSLLAVIIYASPSIISYQNSASAYFWSGLLILMLSLFLWVLYRRNDLNGSAAKF